MCGKCKKFANQFAIGATRNGHLGIDGLVMEMTILKDSGRRLDCFQAATAIRPIPAHNSEAIGQQLGSDRVQRERLRQSIMPLNFQFKIEGRFLGQCWPRSWHQPRVDDPMEGH